MKFYKLLLEKQDIKEKELVIVPDIKEIYGYKILDFSVVEKEDACKYVRASIMNALEMEIPSDIFIDCEFVISDWFSNFDKEVNRIRKLVETYSEREEKYSELIDELVMNTYPSKSGWVFKLIIKNGYDIEIGKVSPSFLLKKPFALFSTESAYVVKAVPTDLSPQNNFYFYMIKTIADTYLIVHVGGDFTKGFGRFIANWIHSYPVESFIVSFCLWQVNSNDELIEKVVNRYKEHYNQIRDCDSFIDVTSSVYYHKQQFSKIDFSNPSILDRASFKKCNRYYPIILWKLGGVEATGVHCLDFTWPPVNFKPDDICVDYLEVVDNITKFFRNYSGEYMRTSDIIETIKLLPCKYARNLFINLLRHIYPTNEIINAFAEAFKRCDSKELEKLIDYLNTPSIKSRFPEQIRKLIEKLNIDK